MKRLRTIPLMIGLLLVLAGCKEEEPTIECEDDYTVVDGVCEYQGEFDDQWVKRNIDRFIEGIQLQNTTAMYRWCDDLALEMDKCEDFYDFYYESPHADDAYYVFELHDQDTMTFTWAEITPAEHSVIEITGTVAPTSSWEFTVDDFTYEQAVYEPITEQEATSLISALFNLTDKEEFCSEFSPTFEPYWDCYNTLTDLEDIDFSNLNDVQELNLDNNGHATVVLGKQDDTHISIHLTIDFFRYQGGVQGQLLGLENLTQHTFTLEEVTTYFEDMFDGGFTPNNKSNFCSHPLYDNIADDYAVDQADCSLHIATLEDTQITIEVWPTTWSDHTFKVVISESTQPHALLTTYELYYDESLDLVSRIEQLVYGTSTEAARAILVMMFMDAKSQGAEYICETYFHDLESCDTDEFMTFFAGIDFYDIASIERANDGWVQHEFVVTVLNVQNDEHTVVRFSLEYYIDRMYIWSFSIDE